MPRFFVDSGFTGSSYRATEIVFLEDTVVNIAPRLRITTNVSILRVAIAICSGPQQYSPTELLSTIFYRDFTGYFIQLRKVINCKEIET